MEFKLVFAGPLLAWGRERVRSHVQAVRRSFQPQLRALWNQSAFADPRTKAEWIADPPALGSLSLIRKVGPFTFAPFISSTLGLSARLGITLLRPSRPGALINHGGDLDNRVKTLLDALRVPALSELDGS